MAELTNERWLNAQYSVLGSALISPEVVPRILHETRESDYQGACQTVYKALRKLFNAGSPIDPVAVKDVLGDGYHQFLLELMEITPTAANVDLYIRLCKEQSRTNQLRDIARQMTEEEDGEKLRSLLEQASGMMVQRSSLKITTMADALQSFMERHTRQTNYLTWPVGELNDRLYAEPGDFIIIGGYPSTGKSAWALQCAWHWARNYKVGFFSLETSSEKLFDRQMASVVKLSMDQIKRNTLGEKDWERICAMSTEITARNLELIPAAGMTPADVRAVTMMRGYQIIFVDYLQLLQGSGENRTTQVTQISIALHTLAQSMGVTVVALSQLARQGKQDKNTPPDMSALRESGQIEQDADLIMMLSLQDKDNPAGPRELRIRKNKEGTCPNILLDFDGKHQTFSKAARTGDVVSKYVHEGKKAQRQNRNNAPVPDLQMTMLPDSTPVPF